MARRDRPADDRGALRRYLLEDAVAFRDRCGRFSEEFYAELSKPVDLLIGGEPYRLYAWELPSGHPAFREHGVNAMCVLIEDDRLVPEG
jgi:hypothetical protein